jgi:sugar lactone lactonase YvrE
MHLLPVLGALEEKHAQDPVAIIGIHSAKFDNEKDPQHILAAMERYGVRHPVLVDSEMAVWNRYGISSWPTLVLIRPNGRVAAVVPGEPDPAQLELAVEQIMADARADGTLAKGPVLKPAPAPTESGPLAFPGKVLVAPDGRLFVADSGHHRVLVLSSAGAFVDQIGSGLAGHRDGTFAGAALDDPQGLALDGQNLYIADDRGQVIVRADLKARTLETVAGTGDLGEVPVGADPSPALQTALRSPWDLAIRGRILYAALAGSHQIAALDLDKGTITRLAGSGAETLEDGGPDASAFAQPSGLSLDGSTLYVADSESSSVRAIDLGSGVTRTLTGTGLFDWSDGTGAAAGQALLQHPLAVAAAPLGLVVADTYNSKLKVFSRDLKQLSALPSSADGVGLWEPGGLSVAPDGSVVVADTNRSRLVRLDPTGKTLTVLSLTGVPAATPGVQVASVPAAATSGSTTTAQPAPVAVEGVTVAQGAPLRLTLHAPDGYELSSGAPVSITLTTDGNLPLAQTSVSEEAAGGAVQDVAVPLNGSPQDASVTVDVRTAVCDARTHKACYPVHQRFVFPVKPGATTQTANLPLAAPR